MRPNRGDGDYWDDHDRDDAASEHRWLAYVRPDGQPAVECRGRHQIARYLELRRKEGCRIVGIFQTADAALRPAPTQEEQSAEIVAGLTASLVNESLRKQRCA